MLGTPFGVGWQREVGDILGRFWRRCCQGFAVVVIGATLFGSLAALPPSKHAEIDYTQQARFYHWERFDASLSTLP